jgi:spermidine/putrescine transport system ATP-binding protein
LHRPEVILQEAAPDLLVESLVKGFGDVTAVDDVSFAINRGEFFSLLGPSGCGKTTTLRLVAGLEDVDGGRIVLEGRDVTSVPPNQRRVNTVFQAYALFPHMTVHDNIAFGLLQSRTPKHELVSKIDSVLETVRLDELRGRYPRELSGGQQQRVALARALVNEPAVLLLDEPLAALDLKLRKAMQGELKKLQERVGVAFLYVTHDQGEALTLSDRIAVMNHGRVLQIGTPREVYEQPRTKFVADFIGETNFFTGRVEEAGKAVVVATDMGMRIRCRPVSWAEVGQSVVVAVRPENFNPAPTTDDSRINAVTGMLTAVTYLGDLLQFHIAVPGARDLVVQRQNQPDETTNWRVGENVTLTWSEENALVLIDDELAEEEDRNIDMAADPVAIGGRRPH